MRRCLLSFIFLFMVSCIGIRKYTPLHYYDLGQAEFHETKLSIGSIHQDGPYKSRIISRTSESELAINEYNRWSQSPDLMLSHYLKKSFQPGGVYLLDGEIISFENNYIEKKATLSFYYEVSKNGRLITTGFYKKETTSGPSPKDFAKSMSKLAKDLTNKIHAKIISLKK